MKFPTQHLDPRLDHRHLRQLLRLAGFRGEVEGNAVTPGQALVVWSGVMLHLRSPVAVPRQRIVLEMLGDLIAKAGDEVESQLEADRPPTLQFRLGIADGAFAVVSGMSNALDLQTSAYVSRADPPLELLTYDLTLLYTINRARILQLCHKHTPPRPPSSQGTDAAG